MATPLKELIPIDTLEFSEEEKQALVELRVSIQDVLKERQHFDNDDYLIKWLRARKLNVSKTENMIRQNKEYFELNGLNYIDKWKIPEAIEKYLPHGNFGEDREGHPVQYTELPWEWEYPWGFPFPWDGNGNGKDFFPVGIPIGIPIGIPMGIPIGIPMGYSNTVSLGHP